MDPSVATTSVHGDGDEPKGIEALSLQVLACRHRVNDGSEGEKLLLLGAQEGLAFEEGDDTFKEIDLRRTTNTRVVSLDPRWFSRIDPQPSLERRRSRTSRRSGFW